MEKLYTIGDAAAELGMPASTIRFYEKNGLIPNQRRSSDGRRLFDEDDLEWMRFVERLKVSGMPIREIRDYIQLYIEGDATIEERRRIVYERRAAIDAQLEKANALAEREGFPKFVSVQNHMNLIFREDEREMLPCCAEEGIALTPYSALASGRLSRRPGETSKRLEEDSYAKFKYDATADADARVIERVSEVADAHGVPMTEVSLAWLLTKVASPVVGATKPHHVNGAVSAVDLALSESEIAYLEEPYVPHAIVGVMAQNKPSDSGKEHVWLANARYLKEERR